MRKLYIMRRNEEDGALAKALLAQGLEPDESSFSNPECPVCSSSTLVAYTFDGEYVVYIWEELNEDADDADEWYLVCSNLQCHWEEQVERVTDPMGAVPFDLEIASMYFDDDVGIGCGTPASQMELIAYIESLLPYRRTARKLQSLLDEAKDRYRATLERVQKWLQRVPPGRMVQITTDDGEVKGSFLTTTEGGCMLLEETGELITVEAESIYTYYPRRFDKWGPDPDAPLPDVTAALARAHADPDGFITVDGGASQRVVVRGFELEFQQVDRFGQFNVASQDPKVAEALGLTQRHEGYWEGRFLRSDIAMRYDVNQMVKVKGFWLNHYGRTGAGNLAVYTEDREAAQALGFQEREPIIYEEEGEPTLPQRPPRWHGVVPRAQVEEETVVKSWHWPLP